MNEYFIAGCIILITISVILLPYVYGLVRLISKAWYKSKNEERNY